MKVTQSKYYKNVGRKINVEIDRFDTWSLDHSLAYIILPALLQLKEEKHGIPGEFANVGGAEYENQESFDFYKDSYDDAMELGIKRWEEILDKMIWSFQQLIFESHEHKYHHGEPNYKFKKTNHKYHNPFTNKVEDTYTLENQNKEYWFDKTGYMLHSERIQEGIELFGKYYQNLWD